LKLVGGPYYTHLLRLEAEYFGGEEGNSLIQWLRIKGK